MLVGKAEELIGMRPWRAQCALVRGLYTSGDEGLYKQDAVALYPGWQQVAKLASPLCSVSL